jgi:hypothetical protein
VKLKTKELTGRALDYAVAKAEGWVNYPDDSVEHGDTWHCDPVRAPFGPVLEVSAWKPSTSAQAEYIIDREMISTQVFDASFKPEVMWNAYMPGDVPVMADEEINGPTRRTAAMRCWVMHKLGAEVEVPDELVENA